MDDTPSIGDMLAAPARRDRRITLTAALSVLAHALVLGWLLFPAVAALVPDAPAPIEVDLVPAPEAPSSEQPAEVASSSASAEAPVSSEAPPASEEQASSEEVAPAAAAPSAEISTASAEPASEAASRPADVGESSPPPAEAPVPASRPLVIPVAPDTPSSEPSSADISSEAEPPLLAASTDTGDGAEAVEPLPPSLEGALHAATRFYLKDMLQAPALARARETIRKLPPEKRLTQTCNIEAVGQIGNAGKNFAPDALVADVFARPTIAGSTYSVGGGAFRSRDKWYAIAYSCTLADDLGSVKSFSFRIGSEVAMQQRAPATPPSTGTR